MIRASAQHHSACLQTRNQTWFYMQLSRSKGTGACSFQVLEKYSFLENDDQQEEIKFPDSVVYQIKFYEVIFRMLQLHMMYVLSPRSITTYAISCRPRSITIYIVHACLEEDGPVGSTDSFGTATKASREFAIIQLIMY